MTASSTYSALNVNRCGLGCDGSIYLHDGAAGMTTAIARMEHTAVNLWRQAGHSGDVAMSRHLPALILIRHPNRRRCILAYRDT